MVALCFAVSHFSLAICPELVSSLLCSCCSPTRPARDVACPPCTRSGALAEAAGAYIDHVGWSPGRRLLVETCMTTSRQHVPSDLPAAADTHGHGPLQTAGGSCVLRMSP